MKHTNENTYWVYVLLCSNNSYYTGYTNDMVRRYRAHCDGLGARYTRSFRPQRLVQCWRVGGDKALAMRLERVIKALPRLGKQALIDDPVLLSELAVSDLANVLDRLG